MRVYSEAGEGSTVKLYLPRLAGEASDDERAEHLPVPASRAGEMILVVEDDENVRTATRDMLRELGYRVITAVDGASALRLVGERPELPVLFTTGYARTAIVHHGRLDPGIHLLSKPFTYAELADKLSRLLADAPGGPR